MCTLKGLQSPHGAILLWAFIFLITIQCPGQSPYYNFHHVTTSDGLSSGVIRGITQDKYGYIWIGSPNGLSRYNGYDVKVFLHAASDSFSIPDNSASGLLSDDQNNLWVIFPNGLYKYEYNTGHFVLQQATKGIYISKIVQFNTDALYLATSYGLALFNPSTSTIHFAYKEAVTSAKALLHKIPLDLFPYSKKLIYITTDTGLVVYTPRLKTAALVQLPKSIAHDVEKVIVDHNDDLWISYGENGSKVARLGVKVASLTVFPEFGDNFNNHIYNFFSDSYHNLWASTSEHGLARFDTISQKFIFFINSPFDHQSVSSYNLNDIFQDSEGFIWIGTEGYGLNFFHPENNLFHTIYPVYQKGISFSDTWSRAVAEDKNGNLWLGSVNGAAFYNMSTGSYKILQNNHYSPHQLYSNSVRALLFDDHEFLWIGTSHGLNRYNTKNGQMDFFDIKSRVPLSFYKTIIQDHDKNIWIGSREGLFRFNYTTKIFEHFDNDSLFAFRRNYNIQTIFEDSRRRLWFGTFSNGALMYDAGNRVFKNITLGNNASFIGNNIRSFAEDKSHNIWIAGSNGLACLDTSGSITVYKEQQGLDVVSTSALLTDAANRLWIGTSKGLYVLDSARKTFKSFSIKDGLTALEFNEQDAFKTSRGVFVYPTLKGFLFFNPDQYKETDSRVNVHISSFKVFNKEYKSSPVDPGAQELQHVELNYDENFFSFEMTALYYTNPEQIMYAYKLVPFDKEWTYSTERIANYTNVPGGKYVFHYKASTNRIFNVPEKTININVAQVFYKTYWFGTVAVLLITVLLYGIYKYRIAQKEEIYSLQGKAQALEKEKAIVQYESLKQQLNPHFLFNSLTSLRSLIRINKETAADFLDKLSLNYRYILKSSETELVALIDELQFAQTYIDMQTVRFGTGLEVTTRVAGDKMYCKIVPVTIQNLIENAIKHNSIDTDNPLRINIYEQDNYLIVQNNLQLKESFASSNKHGLKHLHSLYKYLDNRPLLVEQDDCFFTIKIPLI